MRKIFFNQRLLVNGTNFSHIKYAIGNASEGDTIGLGGKNYINNVYPSDTYANNSTTVLVADLSVVMLVSNKTPNFGDDISWTVVVTNNGPDAARDVYVVNQLPSGLIFIYSVSDGDYDPWTGVWTIGVGLW